MVDPRDRPERAAERPLGLIPATGRSRLLYAWGLATLLLTMLPVWDAFANDARIVAGVLPTAILWSYGVFALVNLLAITVYFLDARPWAQRVDADPELLSRHASMGRREQVFTDLVHHTHDPGRQGAKETGRTREEP